MPFRHFFFLLFAGCLPAMAAGQDGAFDATCAPGHEDLPEWYDRAQEYWSGRACASAAWFDRFFAAGRTDEAATAVVRVIPSIQYSEREFVDSGVRLKARVRLPRFEERLSLVLNDDDEESRGLLPGEVERPEQANAPDHGSSVAFRYLLDSGVLSRTDVDVGLRSKLKLFARIRYRHLWTHRPGLQTRFTQSAWFRDGAGFGETSLAEVERQLSESVLFRWSTQATVSEEANGLTLREGLQLFHQIDADRAISWGVGMTIQSDPAWKAVDYSTSIRYRQRAFRPWFFYEIEPFMDWIRDDGFRTNPGIALRVEFWLGATGRPDPGDAGSDAGPPADDVPPVPDDPSGVTSSPTSDDPADGP